MSPKPFPEANVTVAKDQPEYNPITLYKQPNDPQGTTVILWKLTLRERLRLLWTGELWQVMLTFNKPLTPQHFLTEKPF